jgi:hypothetical protein
MGITQEMIDALFEPHPGSSQDHSSNEAVDREFARIPFHGRAAAVVFPPPFETHAEPVESEVLTTDISRGGLSVLYRLELHPGQQVILRLSRGNCTIEVCWCCRVWPNLYIAGCRFVDATFTDSAH